MLQDLPCPRPVSVFRSASTSLKSLVVASSKPNPNRASNKPLVARSAPKLAGEAGFLDIARAGFLDIKPNISPIVHLVGLLCLRIGALVKAPTAIFRR
jgi:hypothetical protein